MTTNIAKRTREGERSKVQWKITDFTALSVKRCGSAGEMELDWPMTASQKLKGIR